MDKIVVTATIHASIEKVWDCYTNPTHIVNWNFADPSWHCPRAENNMQIGGMYKARMEAKDGSFGFDFEAVYTEINEGKRFTFEFGGRTSTYEFNESGADTLISITFDPETENSIELQKNGWQLILNNFKHYTENEAK
jgi:uncharacterized protein YndB with AHSA1/START domain